MSSIIAIILTLTPDAPAKAIDMTVSTVSYVNATAAQIASEDRALMASMDKARDVLIGQQRAIDAGLNDAADYLRHGDYQAFTVLMNRLSIVMERLEDSGLTLTRQHTRYDNLLRLASHTSKTF